MYDVVEDIVWINVNNVGIFNNSNGFVSIYTTNESGDIEIDGIYGDSLAETPWNRVLQDYPKEEKPYLIRKFDSSRYDFSNSLGDTEENYRSVIVIK